MKQLIALLVLVLLPVIAFGQNTPQKLDNVFVPTTLSGSSMGALVPSASLAETTQAIKVRDWEAVYLNLTTTSGDSTNLLVQCAPSGDGITYGAYATLDSLVNTTNNVKESKSIILPSKYSGLNSVKFIVKGQAHGGYSVNPSGAVRVQIVKKQQ